MARVDQDHLAYGPAGRTFVAIGGHYSIADATPREAALLLDPLFRFELGLRPFPDRGNDYAVAAEW